MVETITEMAGSTGLEDMTLSQLLGYGGKVTILGVCVVFLALVALIFLTWVYPKVLTALFNSSQKRKARNTKKCAPKQDMPAETKAAKAQASSDTVNDPALVAVITAAIAASLGSSSNGIVIKSLRRSASSVTTWGRESRNEQVYNRF